jgi:soluble lytic murein transglycosylase-like protein
MNFKLVAGLSAALLSASLLSTSAKACETGSDCGWAHGTKLKHHVKGHHVNQVSFRLVKHAGMKVAIRHQNHPAKITADRGPVVAMIKAQAPSYGVPTWFALRIAKIESGFNPRARGAAGEYGVYQLKCATARGVGFQGPCSGLLNASTNIRYGLKHLSLAVSSSHGNLRLAASKHNGGLGRKSLVPRYVAMVF